jgi:hypothetical protein
MVVLGALAKTPTSQNVHYRIDNRNSIVGLAPVEELPVLGVSDMWVGVGALALFTSSAIGPPRCHPNMFLLRNAGGGAPYVQGARRKLTGSCAWRSSGLRCSASSRSARRGRRSAHLHPPAKERAFLRAAACGARVMGVYGVVTLAGGGIIRGRRPKRGVIDAHVGASSGIRATVK